MANSPATQRFGTMLTHAGYSGLDKLVIFRVLQIVAILGLALLFMLAAIATAHPPLLSAAAGAAAGYLIPERILRRIVHRRQIRIARELPGTLDLLVVCLEAGVSLMESIRIAARESQRQGRVIGAELTIVAGELNAGLPLEDGLRQLGERTGIDDLKSLTALIIQSERMGSRLGPALRASAEALTTRRRMRAEELAQKSTIKMLVPLVLLILPAMMIFILGPAVLQVLTLLRS
jgi:tight adherence protein C